MKIKCNCGEEYKEKEFKIHANLHDKNNHFAVAIIDRGKEISIDEFKNKKEIHKYA